jgi:hypothetical protein
MHVLQNYQALVHAVPMRFPCGSHAVPSVPFSVSFYTALKVFVFLCSSFSTTIWWIKFKSLQENLVLGYTKNLYLDGQNHQTKTPQAAESRRSYFRSLA